MRIAALYDIHGNLSALEAVLAEVREQQFDSIVIGGDVIPGPMPRETLELLLALDLPTQFILGNGDREVISPTGAVPERYRDGVEWNASELGLELRDVIASWPPTIRREVNGLGSVLFCHATSRTDTEIVTGLTSDDAIRAAFDTHGISIFVCGHTHMQFDRTVGNIRIVNAGSVGMPFGERGAYWLEISDDVHLRCTQYDFMQAAERIRRTQYPQAAEFADVNVLNPPGEQMMLAAFTRTE